MAISVVEKLQNFSPTLENDEQKAIVLFKGKGLSSEVSPIHPAILREAGVTIDNIDSPLLHADLIEKLIERLVNEPSVTQM